MLCIAKKGRTENQYRFLIIRQYLTLRKDYFLNFGNLNFEKT